MHEFNGFFGKHFRYFKPFVAILTHANRGNVAVICWNTLNAATWYVTSENLDGEVALGKDSQSLLEINFVDFTDKNGELKEIENVKVTKTPSMTKDLGDRQVAFDTITWKNSKDEFVNSFDFEIGAPRRNEETSTYIENDESSSIDGELVAYVPEEVWDDLDSLYGKELRVVFGEDNKIALIVVTNDEVIDNEFFTKYVADDKELTIGGEKYKLASTAAKTTTTINNADVKGGLEVALKGILGVDTLSTKKFDKKIKANVILNSRGKVTEVNLYVSGDYTEYNTKEFIVGKVRNEKIQDHTLSTIYDWKDVDTEDLPKVTINDEKASVDEIEVGDVLTVYYKDKNCKADEIVKILVSRNTVEGEVTDINNLNELEVDGASYKMSKATALLVTDEIKDDTTTAKDDFTSYYEENVTLYLNVYGEYVAVMAEEGIADYKFGIVDYYYKAEEDENGVYTQKLRIFVDGAKNTTYKLVYDSEAEDKEIDDLADDPDAALDRDNTLLKSLTDAMNGDKTALIAFKADSNNEIQLDDVTVISYNAAGLIVDSKYDAYQITTANKADYDNKRITIGTKRFNAADAEIAKSLGGTDKPESITWKKLVDQDAGTISVDALVICEKGKYDIVYIATKADAQGGSDATYAVVNRLNGSKTLNNKKYFDVVTLLTENDETIYLSANDKTDKNIVENAIIAYKESSDKVTSSETLVDIDEVNRIATSDEVTGVYYNELIAAFREHVETTAKCACGKLETPADQTNCTDGTHVETTDADAICACGKLETPSSTENCTVKSNITKAALKVAKVDGDYLVYVDDEDTTLPDIKVNTDDVVVFDATGDEVVVSSYDSIEGGELVIPFIDSSEEAILLVIIAE